MGDRLLARGRLRAIRGRKDVVRGKAESIQAGRVAGEVANWRAAGSKEDLYEVARRPVRRRSRIDGDDLTREADANALGADRAIRRRHKGRDVARRYRCRQKAFRINNSQARQTRDAFGPICRIAPQENWRDVIEAREKAALRIKRIRRIRHFIAIAPTIVVGISVQRICTEVLLERVVEAVAIAVRRKRICSKTELGKVCQAIAIAVRARRVCSKRRLGIIGNRPKH